MTTEKLNEAAKKRISYIIIFLFLSLGVSGQTKFKYNSSIFQSVITMDSLKTFTVTDSTSKVVFIEKGGVLTIYDTLSTIKTMMFIIKNNLFKNHE